MYFILQVINEFPLSQKIQGLTKELQNEYINSNAYNITPDTDYWLQQNPKPVVLDLLPLPIQMMIRSRLRPRQFPKDMFSLLEYPFILNSGTKAQIFRYECTNNVPHISKILVGRDSIVDDTLNFIVS